MKRPPNPVPRDYARLYAFANSLDERRFVEDGTAHEGGDALATASQLADWLNRHGLPGGAATAHDEALTLRAALRTFLRAAPAERRDTAIAARLNEAAAGFPLIVGVDAGGTIGLKPAGGASGLAAVLAELQLAACRGDLDRLKMCASEECHWVFYDRSKPGTRRWCASAVCGNRQKTRAYRERRKRKGEAP